MGENKSRKDTQAVPLRRGVLATLCILLLVGNSGAAAATVTAVPVTSANTEGAGTQHATEAAQSNQGEHAELVQYFYENLRDRGVHVESVCAEPSTGDTSVIHITMEETQTETRFSDAGVVAALYIAAVRDFKYSISSVSRVSMEWPADGDYSRRTMFIPGQWVSESLAGELSRHEFVSLIASTDTSHDQPDRPGNQATCYPSQPGLSVQYVNCSAVKVSGTGTVTLRVLGYYEAGDYFQDVERSVDGTEILRAPVDEDLISSNRGYISYVDPGPDLRDEITNPNRDECAERIRPEKIDIFVANATTVGENRYEVTFGYHNPNNFSMSSDWDYDSIASQFSFFMSNSDTKSERQDLSEGPEAFEHTNRSPPTVFEPGRHTFTVTWTPQQADAELIWILNLKYFRYEDPEISASTRPASTINSSTENESESGAPLAGYRERTTASQSGHSA